MPQYRRRVIILGVRKDTKLKLDELYASIANERDFAKELTVRDAIGSLPRLLPLAEPVLRGRAHVSHRASRVDKRITQHDPRYHAPREVRIFREWVENDMNHLTHEEQTEYYFQQTGHHTLYTKRSARN